MFEDHLPYSINSDMFLGLGGDGYSQADPRVRNHNARGYAYEDPGYDPQSAYNTDLALWKLEQERKRRASDAVVGDPGQSSLDWLYGDPVQATGRERYSRADVQDYLSGASPQSRGWVPEQSPQTGGASPPSQFTGTRPGWSDNPAPVPRYSGVNPMLNMTGQGSEESEFAYTMPSRSWTGGKWDESPGHMNPEPSRPYISWQQNVPDEQQQLANSYRLLRLLQL